MNAWEVCIIQLVVFTLLILRCEHSIAEKNSALTKLSEKLRAHSGAHAALQVDLAAHANPALYPAHINTTLRRSDYTPLLRFKYPTETAYLKVVSFSLFYFHPARFPSYYAGLIHNILLVYELLPGWTVRVYYDVTLDPMMDVVRAMGAQTIAMPTEYHRDRSRMWRFLVVDDPDVSWFLCRDTDGRITLRDVAMITKWMESNTPVHIIRDHWGHNTLIQAGMWGANIAYLRTVLNMNMADAIRTWRASNDNYAADEEFLAEVLWPKVKSSALIHDMNLNRVVCNENPGTCTPIPAEAAVHNETFVGMRAEAEGTYECNTTACREIILPWRTAARAVLNNH